MSQRGGKFTARVRVNGEEVDREFTAEQILDKHVGTFFDRFEISIPQEVVETVITYKDIDHNRNTNYLWFAKNERGETPLVMSNLSWDSIERNIYATTSPQGENINSQKIFKLDYPTYVYKATDATPPSDWIPAERCYVEKQAAPANTWKLRIGNTLIPTPIVSPDASGAIFEATKNFIFRSEPLYFSTPYAPNAIKEFSGPDSIEFERLRNAKLLSENFLYEIEHAESKISTRVFWANKISDSKWEFHPHNFWNFIPSESNSNKFKELFTLVRDKMSSLSVSCDKFRLIPGGFYHIHVTNLPQEDAVLLTIHGLYEEFFQGNETYRDSIQEHTYQNINGKKYKVKRPTYTTHTGLDTLNYPVPNRRRETLQKEYVRYRRDHNAYIILKRDTDNHPLYKLSKKSQKGNYFLGMYQTTSFPATAFGSEVLGNVNYDINHIHGKGVMLNPSTSKCIIFCDNLLAGDTLRESIINHFTRFSSPAATNAEIQAWVQNLFAPPPPPPPPPPAAPAAAALIDVAALNPYQLATVNRLSEMGYTMQQISRAVGEVGWNPDRIIDRLLRGNIQGGGKRKKITRKQMKKKTKKTRKL